MKTIIHVLAFTALTGVIYAERMMPPAIVPDAFVGLSAIKSESQVRLGQHGDVRVGFFSVKTGPNDWALRLKLAKESIRSRLASNGWEIDLNANQDPTGRVPFEITIRAQRQTESLLVHATVFLPENGVSDVSFTELITHE